MINIPFFNTRQDGPLCSKQNTVSKSLPSAGKAFFAIGVSTLLTIATPPANADSPGRGQTADFEKAYLAFIIDHHFSALRMTELAAGTDTQRDAPIDNPQEGTSPTPGTAATQAKATEDQIKSMARQANRTQREEILKAQRFLRDWYGINHTPALLPEGRQQIQVLEQTPTGQQFDRTFLQVFSSHHYRALFPSLACQVKLDIVHDQLEHYCNGIVHAQTMEINNMRELLCTKFSICDFEPSANLGQIRSFIAGQ